MATRMFLGTETEGKLVAGLVILGVIGVIITLVVLGNPRLMPIKISGIRQPEFGLVYIAQDKGIFKKKGVAVKVVDFDLGKDALAAMDKKEIDMAVSFETPIMHAIYQKNNLAILSALTYSKRNIALAGRKDRGIIKGINLKDKTINVPKGTTVEYFLYQYLAGLDMTPYDVNVVDTTDNGWDVEGLWSLPLLRAEKTEANKMTFFYSNLYTEIAMLVSTPEYIKKNPKATQAVVDALYEAQEYYYNHPDEAAQIVSSHIPGSTKEELREYGKRFGMEMRLDNMTLLMLNREATWFRDAGMYSGDLPNFRKHIVTDYLGKTDPTVVTVD